MEFELNRISEQLEAIKKQLKAHPKEILTYEEGMAVLNCSRNTMNEFRSKGFFPVYKVGRKVYVKYSELVAFLEKNVERQGQAA